MVQPARSALQPYPNGGFQYLYVDVAEGFEPDTVAGHAGFTERLAKLFLQIGLVVEAKDIYGDARFVGAKANLIKFLLRSVGIVNGTESVPYARIGHYFAFAVFAVGKPELTLRRYLQYQLVQRLHVADFGVGQASEVLFDFFFYSHVSEGANFLSLHKITGTDRAAV